MLDTARSTTPPDVQVLQLNLLIGCELRVSVNLRQWSVAVVVRIPDHGIDIYKLFR